jgi:hypothetical protein
MLQTILLAVVACLGLSAPAVAVPVGYDIEWTGTGGYTMDGMFSFDDSLLGTGAIDETDIDTFVIEGFLDNVSQGTFDLADGLGAGASTFNFNFNTTTGLFIVGGFSHGAAGQQWNWGSNPGLGFARGKC